MGNDLSLDPYAGRGDDRDAIKACIAEWDVCERNPFACNHQRKRCLAHVRRC